MPIAGLARLSKKDEKKNRQETLQGSTPTAVPLVDVAPTGKTAGQGSGAAETVKTKAGASSKAKAKTKTAPGQKSKRKIDPAAGESQQKRLKVSRTSETESASTPQGGSKVKAKFVEDFHVIDENVDDVKIVKGPDLEDPLQLLEKEMHEEASLERDEAWELGLTPGEVTMSKKVSEMPHLQESFFRNHKDEDKWSAEAYGSVSAVPPLPNLLRKWPRKVRQSLGRGLCRRVAPEVEYPGNVEVEKSLEIMEAEVGFFAHAMATCLGAAREGVKQRKEHIELLTKKVEDDKAEAERRQENFKNLIVGFEKQVKSLKQSLTDRDKAIEAEREKLQSDHEAELKRCRDAAFATEQALKEKLEASEKKLEELKAGMGKKIEASVQERMQSPAVKQSIEDCFYQGVNHAARCLVDAQERELDFDLEYMARAYCTFAYSKRLTKHHSVVPYTDEEIEDYQRQLGIPLMIPPTLEEINFRALVKEAKALSESEGEAEDDASVGETTIDDGEDGEDQAEKGDGVESEAQTQGQGPDLQVDPAQVAASGDGPKGT